MIIDVQSIKGGTGKSFVARFAVDHFLNEKPLVIDTDDCNPDVARSYISANGEGKSCNVNIIRSSNESGFHALGKSILKAHKEGRHVIINRGANNYREIREFGPSLGEICKANNIDYITLWVVEADPVCLSHLHEYSRIMGDYAKIAVIKNFGITHRNDEDDFDFLKETNAGQNFPSFFFPDVICVSKALQMPNYKAIHELSAFLEIGTRILSQEPLSAAKEVINDAIKQTKYINV